MQYMLAVYGAPYTSQAPQTALSFAQSAVAAGHDVSRVFFYREGVQVASDLSVLPQGEISLSKAWVDFSQQHNIELIVCISAALRTGLVSDEEAGRQGHTRWNVSSPFILSGLGQLIEGMAVADHFLVFGG